MCKLFVAVALLAVVAAHPVPTADEMKSKLVAAGISDEASAGIVAIADKYKSQFEAVRGDKEAEMKVFEEVKTETGAYVKTQSEADQTAYAKFLEQVKEKMEAHHAAKEAASA